MLRGGGGLDCSAITHQYRRYASRVDRLKADKHVYPFALVVGRGPTNAHRMPKRMALVVTVGIGGAGRAAERPRIDNCLPRIGLMDQGTSYSK
jgi:hypothetical protein